MTQAQTESASEPPPDKPEAAVPEAEAPVRSTRAFVIILIALLWPLEVVSLSCNLVVPAATDVAVHFGARQVGWVFFTILTLGGAVAGPIMTKLGDIHGKKKVMVFGAAAASVGGILAAVAPNFSVLLAGRALQGLLLPLVALSCLLMRMRPGGKRGRP